jgi:hypothetical protein
MDLLRTVNPDKTISYPDQNDLTMLLECAEQKISRGELRGFLDASLGSRLFNVFYTILALAEDIYEERIPESNDVLFDVSNPAYARIMMLPKCDWFEQARLRNRRLFHHPASAESRLRNSPYVSLMIVPPNPRHVAGPQPPHYLLSVGFPTNEAGHLAAETWNDCRGVFAEFCRRADITVNLYEELIKKVEAARTVKEKLRAFFSRFPVKPARVGRQRKYANYSLEIEFAWPFATEFETASVAVLLLYPIYSAVVDQGAGIQDKLIYYWSRLLCKFGNSLPQLVNFQFADPNLRKLHNRQ